jgi:hypothetical protein
MLDQARNIRIILENAYALTQLVSPLRSTPVTAT